MLRTELQNLRSQMAKKDSVESVAKAEAIQTPASAGFDSTKVLLVGAAVAVSTTMLVTVGGVLFVGFQLMKASINK